LSLGMGSNAEAAAMCAKPCAETDEPKIAVRPWRRAAKRLLEGEQNGGAAHVAVGVKCRGAGLERIGRHDGPERLQDVTAPGMGDDPRHRPIASILPESSHGARRELGHRAVQQITELSVALLEAQLVPVRGNMQRPEIEGPEAGGGGRRPPQRRGRRGTR
jgi:hypothetical protein